MIRIVSLGYAQPPTVLDNPTLRGFGVASSAVEILEQTGIEARRTAMPLRYLRMTKNLDQRLAELVSQSSPTNLGVWATRMALSRAGLQADDIGLVLGDCSTPYQTTPSEGQRIAGELGLKIPSFDVSASVGALALHLETLGSWKVAKLPKYVLCVSTNTPTLDINYSVGGPSFYFGDGALAMIVTATEPGKLSIEDVSFNFEPDGREIFRFRGDSHIGLKSEEYLNYTEEKFSESLKNALSCVKGSPDQVKVLASPLRMPHAFRTCEELGIAKENFWTNVPTKGHSLGSSLFSSLAERWEEMATGQKFVAPFAGAGLCHGYVVLKA
jgi:3-oxoacyl-[acyl-carrier-protein] synthase III